MELREKWQFSSECIEGEKGGGGIERELYFLSYDCQAFIYTITAILKIIFFSESRIQSYTGPHLHVEILGVRVSR